MGLAERLGRADGRARVARPDVGDAGRDDDPLGRAQQQPGVDVRLLADRRLAEPQRAVAEPLDLARGGGALGCGDGREEPSQTPVEPMRSRAVGTGLGSLMRPSLQFDISRNESKLAAECIPWMHWAAEFASRATQSARMARARARGAAGGELTRGAGAAARAAARGLRPDAVIADRGGVAGALAGPAGEAEVLLQLRRDRRQQVVGLVGDLLGGDRRLRAQEALDDRAAAAHRGRLVTPARGQLPAALGGSLDVAVPREATEHLVDGRRREIERTGDGGRRDGVAIASKLGDRLEVPRLGAA